MFGGNLPPYSTTLYVQVSRYAAVN